MRRLDAEFLARSEGIATVARRAWGPRFLGFDSKRLPLAAGTDSSSLTDYATGDDFRHVDWNRAARLDELVSRQFRGVETGRLDVVLDLSPSMRLGRPTKLEFGCKLAAAIGCLALKEHRGVRLIGCGAAEPDRTVYHGAAGAPALLRALTKITNTAGDGGLNQAAATLRRHTAAGPASRLAVVVSDLMGPNGFEAPLATLARSTDALFVLHVLGADDVDPTALGRVQLTDVESGVALSTELDDDDLVHYRAVVTEFLATVRNFCRPRGIGLVQCRADGEPWDCVAEVISTAGSKSA